MLIMPFVTNSFWLRRVSWGWLPVYSSDSRHGVNDDGVGT